MDRQRGSHVMLKKDGSSVVLSIPQHRQLGKGLLRSLIADSGLSVAEFVEFLNPVTFVVCASCPCAHVRHGYFQFVNFAGRRVKWPRSGLGTSARAFLERHFRTFCRPATRVCSLTPAIFKS